MQPLHIAGDPDQFGFASVAEDDDMIGFGPLPPATLLRMLLRRDDDVGIGFPARGGAGDIICLSAARRRCNQQRLREQCDDAQARPTSDRHAIGLAIQRYARSRLIELEYARRSLPFPAHQRDIPGNGDKGMPDQFVHVESWIIMQCCQS
ncbi:hypothetical protein PX699_21645 [Sphingobium sp. H39-3-25]|uniref:hypothetical protein n=1 Tax=Sphingobium arseniciresistens TaxID=3030834 RepID=UPI0023B8CF01|nr:hypothetical protein [Sphingobium arseniciresistens]